MGFFVWESAIGFFFTFLTIFFFGLAPLAILAAPEDRTVFSYRFCQPEDEDRELFLTVMAFDIPNKQEGEDSEQTDQVKLESP